MFLKTQKTLFIYFIFYIFTTNIVFGSQSDDCELMKNNTNYVLSGDKIPESDFIKKTNNKNGNKGFFKKYIYTDENPIFGKKNNMISVSFGYSWSGINKIRLYSGYIEPYSGGYGFNKNLYETWYNMKRHIYHIGVTYSRKNKPFNLIHGRFSLGLFGMVGKANGLPGYTNKREEIVGYRDVGIECTEEIVLGNPMLYITGGFGFSYIFPRKDNNLPKHTPERLNSLFNFVILATIGHRFGDTFVVELMWKHYSNGELRSPNFGINQLGVNIGFVF